MRHRLSLIVFAVTIVTTVGPVFAAPAAAQSFLGEWTAKADSPPGAVSETLKVAKTDTGFAITAKLVEPVPPGLTEAGPGMDIALDGDKFSYRRTTPDGAIVITYTGIVTGDTFTGTVDLGRFCAIALHRCAHQATRRPA